MTRAALQTWPRRAAVSGRSIARALWLGCAMLAVLSGCHTVTTINGAVVSNNTAVPGAVEGDDKKRAAVHLQLAANYYQSGQLQTAIETAHRAIELDPNSAAAYGLLGLMLMDAGQVVLARTNFEHALQIDRDNPDLNNNFGWFLCQTGKEAESITYFDRAAGVRLYASPARALQNAGICLMRVHDDVRAEQYLLRALASDATSPVAKFQLASLYLHQRRFDRCDFYFDLLLHSADPNAETLWLGVRIAHAEHDVSSERSYGEQLSTRFPDSPQNNALHHGRFDE